jgi:uncharacterized membrane protein YfcA
MEWTPAGFLVTSAIVLSGALLQAASGLGAGLIVVPLLSLISTELVPAPMIFASLALSASMTMGGRRHIEFTRTPPIIAGIVAGTVVAAWFISNVPSDALGLVFGVSVLTAVVISTYAPAFELSTGTAVLAGVCSGVLGTSAGIGAPVLALLYQHFPGRMLRATLAFLYFVSSIVMLIFLHFAGRFGGDELRSGFLLVPGFVAGYFLSPRLAAFVDRGYARPVVLVVSAASAGLLILRSVRAG